VAGAVAVGASVGSLVGVEIGLGVSLGTLVAVAIGAAGAQAVRITIEKIMEEIKNFFMIIPQNFRCLALVFLPQI